MNCPKCNAKMHKSGLRVRVSGVRQAYYCPKCGHTTTVKIEEEK